jgi:hypothetical protein
MRNKNLHIFPASGSSFRRQRSDSSSKEVQFQADAAFEKPNLHERWKSVSEVRGSDSGQRLPDARY